MEGIFIFSGVIMTEAPRESVDLDATGPIVSVRTHNREVDFGSTAPELQRLIGESLHPGTPVMIELNGRKAKLREGTNDKILFLSDGEYSETSGFRASTCSHGCTVALINSAGMYRLVTNRDNSLIMTAQSLERDVVKKVHIDQAALQTHADAIRALQFAHAAIYVDPSEYGVDGQETSLKVTADFIRDVFDQAVGKEYLKATKVSGKRRELFGNKVRLRFVESLYSDHPLLNPNDLLVCEDTFHGHDIAFMKFDESGRAYLLPRWAFREFVESAFDPARIRQARQLMSGWRQQ